ncbi:MAG TPA: hypothetical protein VIG48_06250 [Jatrophihabitans sp.]
MSAALVLTEVGLWQWRMVVAARGSRSRAMLLGTLTAHDAVGVNGPVRVLFVRINRRHETRLHRDVAAPRAGSRVEQRSAGQPSSARRSRRVSTSDLIALKQWET